MTHYQQAKQDIRKYKRRPSTYFKKMWSFIWYLLPMVIPVLYLDEKGAFDSLSDLSARILSIIIIFIMAGITVFITSRIKKASRNRRLFYKELRELVPSDIGRYTHVQKNTLETSILSMKHKPKRLHEIIAFYSHLSAILANRGELDEAIELLTVLEKQGNDGYTRKNIGNLREYINSRLLTELVVTLNKITEQKKIEKEFHQ